MEHDRIPECEAIAARYGIENDELTRTYLRPIEASGSFSAVAIQPAG